MELITKALVDGELEPAQECLLLAGSDEQNPMVLIRGVDQLRLRYPECLQRNWQEHGRYLYSIHGPYAGERGYNVELIQEMLEITDGSSDDGSMEEGETEPEMEEVNENNSSDRTSDDRFTVEAPENRRIRFLASEMNEVSSPEHWMGLHNFESCSDAESEDAIDG